MDGGPGKLLSTQSLGVLGFYYLVPLSCMILLSPISPISGLMHHHHQVHFQLPEKGSRETRNQSVYFEMSDLSCSHSICKTMTTLAAREAGKCSQL